MGDAAAPLPTFEELYERIRALPEGMTGEILEPGVLHTMSRPSKAHRRVHSAIARRLGSYDANFDGKGWWIESEIEIRFPLGRLAVPDLAGFRIERVPELPDENPLTTLPDWCCELLSPSTERKDRTEKLPLYARSGVGWTWIVDPLRHTVEVFETTDGKPTLTVVAKDGDSARLPPFDGEIDVGAWWIPGSEPQE